MGVIIKYQLEFTEASLKISNDLFKGDFIIDADIEAKMLRGVAGSSFTIKLYDLPLKKAQELDKMLQAKKLVHVILKLGYFDDPFETVMEGIFTKIRSTAKPEDDKLITTIEGLETATHLLQHTPFQKSLPGEKPMPEVVKFILQQAKFTTAEIDQQPQVKNVSCNLKNKILRGKNLLQILDELAECAQAELLVRDKKVWMGKPITDDSYKTEFQRDRNLAVFRPFIKDIPEEAATNLLQPLSKTKVQGFEFTITGDPQLRPGHKVVAAVDGYDQLSGAEFRVHSLVHKLSMTAGYVCEGVAVKVCTDDNCRRQQAAAGQPSAETITESLTKKMQAEQSHRPSVEIGQINAYTPEKHLTTLYFGQRFERDETQPSVNTKVDKNDDQLFQNKPMVSPFAWHKCGLVVPVYPGMKALLNHNLNLPDDALVAGFIWSKKPPIEPPKNKEGDWWLCLPIDFDTAEPPSDNTKAVNDLIANNGKRVIEVKGLKITIGNDKLKNVGARPSEGADDEFLIEHKSGTKFTIAANGALAIEAQNISLKGNVTVEGKVDVK